MKIAILHLSDIHIQEDDDWIISRADKIAQAVLGTWEKLETIFIVITGDIANQGTVEQYKLASKFLASIKSYLQQQTNTEVRFILAPGNHDCDFSDPDQKARNAFIEMVRRTPDEIQQGDSIYRGCLNVQKNFFDFAKTVEPDLDYPSEPEAFFQIRVNVNGGTFYFNIFNTAWLSEKHEDQGGLVFLNQIVDPNKETLAASELSITLLHHPDNWLDSSNGIEFRRVTEQISDLILSGHEHHGESFVKHDPVTRVETQIIKAGALQDRDRPTSSTFNLIVVDLDERKQQSIPFKWGRTEYKKGRTGEWRDFVRNRFLTRHAFHLAPEFERYLDTLDSLTWQSRKKRSDIKLESFFIPPRLYVTSLKKLIAGKADVASRIETDKFYEFILSSKQLIIFGDTWQGKTTTAKMVYKFLHQHQYATVLANGSKFEKAEEETFQKVIAEEFSNQFNEELVETFFQLPKEKRALLIDNFGRSNLNQESLQNLLEFASNHFDIVVVFAHSDLSLQEYAGGDGKKAKFSEYVHSRMLPLNQTQRTQLIRSWIRCEADPSSEEDEIIRQEHQLSTQIRLAVNTGVIASTPFFILGVLQLIESFTTNPKSQFGSIGYIYQGLMTGRLSDLHKTPAEIDRFLFVTSLLAHWMYKKEAREVEQDDLANIVHEYNNEYKENVVTTTFADELVESQILLKIGSKRWKFAGSHLRDFFVAKYYAHILGDEETEEKKLALQDIQLMVETVKYEPHMRILLFLVYEANSNRKLIRWILDEARRIYKDKEVANFTSDVQFLNDLDQSQIDANVLESGDARENKDRRDALISESEEEGETPTLSEPPKTEMVRYAEDADEFTKVAIALKTIELVGQLVKSFPGTIRGGLKQELIEECINIGLRMCRAFLDANREEMTDLSQILRELVRDQNPRLTKRGVEQRIEELIVLIHHWLAYGVIKKISNSVGHEDLKNSFNDIFASKKLLSYKLVETAIRLDHYDSPLADQQIQLGRRIKDNKFAYHILSRLVADYVNYFEIRGPERQKLIDNFRLLVGKEYLFNLDKAERDALLPAKGKDKFNPKPNKKDKFGGS
jgi:predicted MPP superfamily phosphohydrolase